MTVESATYIDDLVATNPAGTDAKSEGDDHIRLIKSTLKATFPAVEGAVTVSHTDLNAVTSKLALAGGTMAGDVDFDNNDLGGLKTASFDAEYDAGSSGTTKTIDWNNGGKQKLTLSASCAVSFTAPPGPTSGLVLKVIQAAAGGYNITWPATVKWQNSLTPTVSSPASRHDLFAFYYDGTNYYGTSAQNYTVA